MLRHHAGKLEIIARHRLMADYVSPVIALKTGGSQWRRLRHRPQLGSAEKSADSMPLVIRPRLINRAES